LRQLRLSKRKKLKTKLQKRNEIQFKLRNLKYIIYYKLRIRETKSRIGQA